MIETGSIENAGGTKTGIAGDLGTGPLGWEWWVIANETVTSSSASKKTANLFASFSTLIQSSISVKGYGEISSGTFLPVGLSLTAAAPMVATVDIVPGAKITFDSVKMELTTNKAYINSMIKVKLSDAEVRQTMADVKATLATTKRLDYDLVTGAFEARIAQVVQG